MAVECCLKGFEKCPSISRVCIPSEQSEEDNKGATRLNYYKTYRLSKL